MPAGDLIPGAAESWEISEDGLTYTFKLRPDGKWSNGDPVTVGGLPLRLPADHGPGDGGGLCARSSSPSQNAEAVNKGEMPGEELGVAAPDPQTLVFTLNTPTPYFLQLLTHQTGKPLHQASVEEFGDRVHQARQPGDERRLHAGELRAERQDRAEEEPELLRRRQRRRSTTVEWIPFEDRSACLRRFEAGEVPICADVPAEQMAYMKEKLPNNLRIAPYLGAYYLPVKTAKEKFADPRVRQAISMLIDRDFIADEVWQGTMLPAYCAGAAGDRQLRRERARARLCRRWTCSTARTRR